MHVTELEINNFKSFSGVTRIPFFEGFTVISGPNGSGKSNIIDSLLFVLSLSTSSGLRAEKLTDLINLNSGRNLSEVKATFSDGTTIKRRIKRAAHGYYSYYYLNERVSTQMEILEFLSRHGIKPEGYNVVMQGDITRIMEMSNLERRRIIDEIAGVAEFDLKREQALEELEIVRERIEREEIVLRELESRMGELERERERAVTYRHLLEETEQLEAARNVAQLKGLEKEHATLIEVIEEQRKGFASLEALKGEKERLLEVARGSFREIEDCIAQKSGPEYMSLVASVEERKGNIKVAEQTIERLVREKGKDEENLNRIFMDLKRAEARMKEISDRLKEMNIDRANLAMDLSTRRASLEEVEKSLKGRGKEVEEAKERLLCLMKDLEAAKEERSQLIHERDTLNERTRIRTSEIERIEGLLSRYDEESVERRKRRVESEAALKEKEKMKERCDGELASVEQRLFSARKGLEDIRIQTRSLEQELARLEAQQQARDDSGNRALEAVLGMEGIFGTISTLGKAEKEYALALEVAAGARLGYVIARDDRVAEDAIRYLKETRLGRLTFLPLNRLNPPTLPKVRETGVLGYAVEFLEFDRRFEPAFRVAFGQTLVMDTLEHARALLGRHRMVTLEGELLEKTGAMTGGHLKKGRSLLISLAGEISRVSDALTRMRAETEDLEGVVRRLTAEAERTREERSRISEEIARSRAVLEEIARREEEHAKERGALEASLASYRREIGEGAGALAELEKKINGVNARIGSLASDIDRTNSELKQTDVPGLAARMEKERQEMTEIERRLRNKEGEITDLQRERSYFSKRTEELEAERQRIVERHRGVDAEVAALRVQMEEDRERVAELQQRLKSFSHELEELRVRREAIMNEMHQAERALSEAENSIERTLLQIKALEERADSMQTEIEEMRAQCRADPGIDLPLEEIERRLSETSERLKGMGAVNMLAIDEYEQVSGRVEERRSRKETLSSERTSLIERIERFEQMKFEAFMKAFREIDSNFRKVFARLMSGSGNLVLENEEDPFSGGLTFAIKPQDKKIHILSSLSGGEKSVVTLAFIFAIQQFMPAPFYAMDEIDMFLDGSNVERVAAMIKELAGNTQFILVSLRKPMIDRADRILGVTLRPDKSTLVTGVKANG
ncbi:MAG: chromosome segregation protein SMC [Methanomicrobiales archaeon]|nr:chromosome segregation protein SMC [Methanomicrobiales archaeon]